MKYKEDKFVEIENFGRKLGLHIWNSWKFKFVDVILKEVKNHQIDLQERIKNVNKTYFMLQNLFGNKNISRKLKLRLKNTIIDNFNICIRNLDSNKDR
jgi:hypothetical protein